LSADYENWSGVEVALFVRAAPRPPSHQFQAQFAADQIETQRQAPALLYRFAQARRHPWSQQHANPHCRGLDTRNIWPSDNVGASWGSGRRLSGMHKKARDERG
jgi:hypothetical protein